MYWFCHTSTWIRHGCTRVPNPEPLSYLRPHTIPPGHPSSPAPSILYPTSNLDWRFISYMILYMFQCHSPKSSPTPIQFFNKCYYVPTRYWRRCACPLDLANSVFNHAVPWFSLSKQGGITLTQESLGVWYNDQRQWSMK